MWTRYIWLGVDFNDGCNEISGILRSECGSPRWRTGGEVKGKLANGVGSQYSHTTSEPSVSSITNADAHNSAAVAWRESEGRQGPAG